MAEDGSRDIYEDQTSNRTYVQPRTKKDFYYNKWTDFKAPDWYHPYNGTDARSEFLYLRKNANTSPYIEMTKDWMDKNRLFLYLGGFLLAHLVELGRDYLR